MISEQTQMLPYKCAVGGVLQEGCWNASADSGALRVSGRQRAVIKALVAAAACSRSLPQSWLTEDTSSLNCLRDVNTHSKCCLSALNGPKGQLHGPSVSRCIRIIKSAEAFPWVRREAWQAGRGSIQQARLLADLGYHQRHVGGNAFAEVAETPHHLIRS